MAAIFFLQRKPYLVPAELRKLPAKQPICPIALFPTTS